MIFLWLLTFSCGFLDGPRWFSWALMGPYGPLWALMGPPGQVLAGPISDFWFNFPRFGFKIGFLTKFIHDSA